MSSDNGLPMRESGTMKPNEISRDLTARELLLNAACDLMVERGVHNVALGDIGDRSGLNPALIAYYFGNKAGMMLELLRMILRPGIEQMQVLADREYAPAEKLRIHVAAMVDVYFRYPFINRLMHQLQMDDMDYFGARITAEFSRPVAEAQARILQQGVAAGDFKDVDPMIIFVQIVGSCDQLFTGSYQLEYIFATKVVDQDLKRRFVDHLVTTLLRGIDPRQP
ncbi:TetR family transcriptional regulator [Novosphingobium sp. HII-3]|uniref:TetR family transcriptional regulator n=1 Tax=Novosphingobium sp. HII-3 TaxID=2075565 RepID=UPI001E60D2B1|nr:TetR family transcriptional regulator [Novosphingobium sp. HII-3]